jgi:GT2 family glycosyltransferase
MNSSDMHTQLELRRKLRLARVAPVAPLQNEPLVSVIVLNLNGEAVIGRCLEQLLAQSYKNFEIIVVDNGSQDGSLAVLETFSGRMQLIKLPHNRGVGGGRNAGLQAARAELIAFVDNDGYPEPDWLLAAVNALLAIPNTGAVSSVVSFAKKPLLLNGTGGEMNFSGYAQDINYGAEYETAVIPTEVLYPMGCGMVVRKELLAVPFDDKPLRWYDDVEVGLRAWSRGLRVVVAPGAFIDHDAHLSEATVAPRGWQTGFQFECARIRTALKYYPREMMLRWCAAEAGAHLLRRPQHIALYFAAWVWNIIHLPSLIALRRKLKLERGRIILKLIPTFGPLQRTRK